ncbi:MAG: hypothetical protein ACE5JF_13455, partial [Anaerolineales bacterium]
MIWALKKPSAGTVVVGALAQALFFFSGNLYHQIYAGATLLIIGVAYFVDLRRTKLRMLYVLRFVLVGVIGFGLIAVQLLPMATSLSSIRNDGGFIRGDHEFPGSQRPEHAILNYLVSDPWFYLNPNLDRAPFIQEGYRFVGIVPFILLLFLVPAYRQGNRRDIVAFAASFVLLVGWASLQYTLVKFIYDAAPILYQFRFPGRALSVGTLFLVVLSGFGLNYLWDSWRQYRQRLIGKKAGDSDVIRRGSVMVIELLLVVGMILGLHRAYDANREMFSLDWIGPPETWLMVDWLSAQDPENLTILARDGITKKMTIDAYQHNFRLLSFVDGWRAAPAPNLVGRFDALQVKPSYQIDWVPLPLDTQGYELAFQVRDLRVWHDPNVHPAAFLIPADRLDNPSPITADEAIPVISYERADVNSLTVDLEAKENSILVVLESWFDGWTAAVDGEQTNLLSVSNFLAVRVPSGRHT